MISKLLLVFLLLFSANAFSAECTAYEKLHPTYPLTGAHLSTGKCTSCGTCHINSIWTGTPRTCIACHNGDPSRMTVGRSAKHLPTLLLDCGGCHTTTSFTSGTTRTKTHNTAVAMRCDSCHNGMYTSYGARGKSKDHPTRYTIGGVSVLVASVDCSYCHNTANWDPKK